MGEFNAGKWIIGLCVYFFVFFVVVMGVINGLTSMGESTGGLSVNDPGFETASNQFTNLGNGCTGLPSGPTCDFIVGATPDVCALVPGCSYNATYEVCQGDHNVTACGSVADDAACVVLGCTLVTGTFPSQTSNSDDFDWSTIRDSLGLMTGFSANVALPGGFQFMFSFVFFYLPFFALLWAVYMALPFIH